MVPSTKCYWNRWPSISVQVCDSGLPLPLPVCLPPETRLAQELPAFRHVDGIKVAISWKFGALSVKGNSTIHLSISVSKYPEISISLQWKEAQSGEGNHYLFGSDPQANRIDGEHWREAERERRGGGWKGMNIEGLLQHRELFISDFIYSQDSPVKLVAGSRFGRWVNSKR